MLSWIEDEPEMAGTAKQSKVLPFVFTAMWSFGLGVLVGALMEVLIQKWT